MPDYWYPGLDLRHTEAFFFLKKLGFKKGHIRNNLCLDLNTFPNEKPPSEFNDINIRRATEQDKAVLLNLSFMPWRYRKSSWPAENILSFKNDPVSTFVALDKNDKILGWATHSVGFPGTFGPTGVEKKSRGKGIGGLLLKWCLWDIKQKGIDQCVIRWVGDNTAYFYLKSVGAHFCESYWTMKKRF
jgi:hypothetical protein